MSKDGHLKTTFQTRWGTYAYEKIPFGLINIGTTFQGAMDIAFWGIINRFVVVYLDDIIVYSKICKDHIPHCRVIFERCWCYDISLDPKEIIFNIKKGKLLGFIISLDSIMIDTKRAEPIKKIVPPHNKISMQSFLGKINFVGRFISDFAEIASPLQEMIKKDADFKWTKERKYTFIKRKESIAKAPTLRSLDFEKDFILYTFAYDHSIAVVLT